MKTTQVNDLIQKFFGLPLNSKEQLNTLKKIISIIFPKNQNLNSNHNDEKKGASTVVSWQPHEVNQFLKPFLECILDFDSSFQWNNVLKHNLMILTAQQDPDQQTDVLRHNLKLSSTHPQMPLWDKMQHLIHSKQIDLYQLSQRFNSLLHMPGACILLRENIAISPDQEGPQGNLLTDCVEIFIDAIEKYIEAQSHKQVELHSVNFNPPEERSADQNQKQNSQDETQFQGTKKHKKEQEEDPNSSRELSVEIEDIFSCLISIVQTFLEPKEKSPLQTDLEPSVLNHLFEVVFRFLSTEKFDKQAIRNSALLLLYLFHYSFKDHFYLEMKNWMLKQRPFSSNVPLFQANFFQKQALLNFAPYTQLCLLRSLTAFCSTDIKTCPSEALMDSVLKYLTRQLISTFSFPDLRETYNKNVALENFCLILELLLAAYKTTRFQKMYAMLPRDSKKIEDLKAFLLYTIEKCLSINWDVIEDPYQLFSVTRKNLIALSDLSAHFETNYSSFFNYPLSEESNQSLLKCLRTTELYKSISNKLSLLSWERKSKYIVISMLIEKKALAILMQEQNFFLDFLQAFQNPVIRTTASATWHETISALKTLQSNQAITQLLIPNLLTALVSTPVDLRSLTLYAFLPVFKTLPYLFSPLLEEVLKYFFENKKTPSFFSVLFAVLKEARKTKAIASLDQLFSNDSLDLKNHLKNALSHSDLDIVLDSLDFICSSEQVSSPIEAIELQMIRFFFDTNIRCGDARFRQEAAASLKKFLLRIKFHLGRYFKFLKKNQKAPQDKQQEQPPKDNEIQQLVISLLNSITNSLLHSCYPSSTYHRQQFALELLESLSSNLSDLDQIDEFANHFELYSSDAILTLFHTLWNSFDISRSMAFTVLSSIPRRFFDFLLDSNSNLKSLLETATRLLNSPRSKEGECGTHIFLLILEKTFIHKSIIVEFQSTSDLSTELNFVSVPSTKEFHSTKDAVCYAFLLSLYAHLKFQLEVASKDLKKGCQFQPMHGTLTLMRKILESLNLNQLPFTQARQFLRELIQTTFEILDVCQIVLGDLSPEGYEDFETSEKTLGQLLSSVTFMSLKEVCFILGKISVSVTMPTSEEEDLNKALLNTEWFEKIGEKLLFTLLNVKHKGAIDKAALGFLDLSSGLLAANYSALVNLPFKWIQFVFSKIEDQELVLRRSAGLPYVFSGILKAELYQKGKESLCNFVMKKLLSFTKKSSLLPQIHSTNILYRLSTHSGLNPHISKYAEELFQVSLVGFQSSDWGVRNSSTLLFSSMCDRMVFQRRSSGSTKGVKFSEFFNKWPSLYTHLLEHFKSITFSLNAEKGEREDLDKFTQQRAILESCLYALLLMISRLKPDPFYSQTFSPKPFIPFIVEASFSSNWMVRKIAALALVPLLAPTDFISFSKSLISSLSEKSNYNKLHGKLLQLEKTCEAHIPLLPPDLQNDMVTQVLPLLTNYQNLIYSPVGALPISFFNIIFNHFEPGNKTFEFGYQSACNLLKDSSHIQVATQLALEAICQVALKKIFHDLKTLDLQQLDLLLYHPAYEVRYKTLKYIQNIKLENLLPESQNKLSMLLLNLLITRQETHHKCLRKIFKLISNIQTQILLACLKNEEFFTCLINFFPSPSQFKALPFLGFCFQSLTLVDLPFDPFKRKEACDTLLQKLIEFRKPENLLDFRESAVQCVFNILQIKQEQYNTLPDCKRQVILECWLTAVILLSDMDGDIREDLTSFVSTFFNENLSINNSMAPEIILNFLNKHFNNSPRYFSFLLNDLVMFTTNPIQTDINTYKPFFEIDESNDYEEQLIKIQLATLHIQKIIQNQNVSSLEETKGFLIEQFNILQHYVKDQAQSIKKNYLWSSFISFQPIVFTALFRNFSGLIALSPCLQGHKPQILQTAQQFLQLPLHPILKNQLDYLTCLLTQDPKLKNHETIYYFGVKHSLD